MTSICWSQNHYARARRYVSEVKHSNSISYRYELVYKLAYVYDQAMYMCGRPADPLTGTALKTLRRSRYIACSLYIASKCDAVLRRIVASCARAHTHAAWHAHAIYWHALRVQLSERLRRRLKRQPQLHMICRAGDPVGGRRSEPPFCRFPLPTAHPRIAFESVDSYFI